MEYTSDDYKGLLFPVHSVKDYTGSILNLYPELSKYDEFHQKPEADINEIKLFKYLILVYDKKTPYITIDDIYKRKYHACMEAEFPKKNTGDLRDEYLDIIEGKNFIANLWLMRILRFQKSASFSKLKTFEDQYYLEIGKIGTYSKPGDKATSIKIINEMQSEIDNLITDFLSGDSKNTNIVNFLYNYKSFTDLNLSVEDLANDFREGKNRVEQWNIYTNNKKKNE